MADPKAEKKMKKKVPTAQKRDIRNDKKRQVNKTFKSRVRTTIRQFETCVGKGDEKSIQESLSQVYSLLDKAVKRNIIKLNKASRMKARLTARASA